MFRLETGVLGLGALILVGALLPAEAEEEKSPTPPIIDPRAQQVVDDFGRFLAGLNAFAVQITSQIQVGRADKPIAIGGLQRLAVERPAKLVFSGRPSYGPTMVRSDGTSVATYFLGYKQFVSGTAPKTCEGLIEILRELRLIHPAVGSVVTSALLADDPAKKLVSTAQSVHYRGIEKLDGIDCHLIHAVDKEMDWQMWIDAGEKPLVRQLVPDVSKVAAKLPMLAGAETTSVVRFDWKLNPVLKATFFEFRAPEGATEAKSFAEVVGADQLHAARDASAVAPAP